MPFHGRYQRAQLFCRVFSFTLSCSLLPTCKLQGLRIRKGFSGNTGHQKILFLCVILVVPQTCQSKIKYLDKINFMVCASTDHLRIVSARKDYGSSALRGGFGGSEPPRRAGLPDWPKLMITANNYLNFYNFPLSSFSVVGDMDSCEGRNPSSPIYGNMTK